MVAFHARSVKWNQLASIHAADRQVRPPTTTCTDAGCRGLPVNGQTHPSIEPSSARTELAAGRGAREKSERSRPGLVDIRGCASLLRSGAECKQRCVHAHTTV